MPSDVLATAIVTVIDLLTTYLLHSTLLLGIVALAVWCCRTQSHVLTERLWKSAAVIPLMTAPLQLLSGIGNPVMSPRWVQAAQPVIVDTPQSDVPETLKVDDSERTSDPYETVGELQTVAIDVTPFDPVPLSTPADILSAPLLIEDAAEAKTEPMPSTDAVVADIALTERTEKVSAAKSASIDPRPPVAAASPSLPLFATRLAGLAVAILTLGFLRFLAAGHRFRRRIRKFRTIDTGPVRDALGRVIRRSSLRRRVRLLEADDVGEPIAFGIWQWTIAVPRGIETRLNNREMEALLAHELAHLVRGDAWWLLMGRLLCGCLPFQPLNFVARIRWRQASEFQCDDWAAARTGNPLSLAHCLTRVAEWRLDAASCAHALPAGGPQSTLSRRVERLLADRPTTDPWSRSRRRRLLTAFTLIVAAVLCWHGPRTTLLAQFDEERDGLTFDSSASIDAEADILADEIHSLDAELRQLEADLRKVESLVHTSNPPPEVSTLAARLSARLADLRRHRRELLARAGPVSTPVVPVRESTPPPLATGSEPVAEDPRNEL
jgi:beta-lactamase regulating signal transducer with metallopeptidase domain